MSAPLARVIGQRALTLTLVNGIVASGIFGLPAAVAADLGRTAVVAYVVCTVLFLGVSLCFAEAGSRVAGSGGLYAYAAVAFGPFMGSFAGTLVWGSNCLANAAVASLFADTATAALPALGGPGIRPALLVALYCALALLNVRGTQLGARASELLTVVKLTPLLLLVAGGLGQFDLANIVFHGAPAVTNFAHAVVLLCFAFTGAEVSLCVSGEVKDPERTLPRAILVAMLATAALYIALQLVAQSALGDALATSGQAPLAAAAAVVFPGWGRSLVLVATLLSTLGFLSGDVLATPRALYALGRDGLLPGRLGAVHARFGTPYLAILAYAALACAFALTGSFAQLAFFASAGTLVLYLTSALAVLVMRRRGVQLAQPPFVIPGGPVVPIASCALILTLLAGLAPKELLGVAAMLLVATLLYLVRRRVPAAS